MRELRSLVVTITPPQLHVQGLAATLTDLAATLEVRGIAVTVAVSGTEMLDETTETLVYHAAQEAVRNIVRHADASTVTLTVARAGDGRGNDGRGNDGHAGRPGPWLVLRVHDNGRGFRTEETDARSRGSVGLELLSTLAASHGGILTLDAAPGRGTELVLRVPVAPTAEPPVADTAQDPESAGSLR